MAYGPAITKRMQLLVEWADKGFQAGLDKKKSGLKELKKQVRDIAKAMIAATAAAVGLTAGLLKLIKQGSEVKSVTESFEGFVRAAEMSPDTLDKVRESVRGTISDLDLMQSSVQALATGLPGDELLMFWRMSKQMADVMSRDTKETFDNLTRAMNKQEVEALEMVGITIRMEDVMRKYKQTTGKTTKEITLLDRRTALLGAVLEKFEKDFLSVGDVTNRTREAFQKLETGVKNVWHEFVAMVADSPKVMAFLSFLSSEVKNIDERLESMRPGLDRVIATIILMGRKGVDAAKGVRSWKDELLSVGSVGVIGFLIMQLAKFKVAITGAFGAASTPKFGIAGIVAYLALNYKRTLQGLLTIIDTINRTFYGGIGAIAEGIQLLLKAIDKIPGIDLSDQIKSFEPTLAYLREQTFGKTQFDKWKESIEKWPSLFDLLVRAAFGGKDKFKGEVISLADEIANVTGGIWKEFEKERDDAMRRAAQEAAKQGAILAKEQFFKAPKLEMPKPIYPKVEPLRIPDPIYPVVRALKMPDYPKVDALQIPDPIYPVIRALEVPAYPRIDPLRIPDPIYPKVVALKIPAPIMPDVRALHIPDPIYPKVMALKIPRPEFEGEWPVRVPAPIYPEVAALRIPPPILEGRWPAVIPAPIYERAVPPVIAAPLMPKIPAIEVPRPVGMDQAEADIEYYKEMIMTLKAPEMTVPYLRAKYEIPEPVKAERGPEKEKLVMLDEEEQAFVDSYDARIEKALELGEVIVGMNEGMTDRQLDLWEYERVAFLRNMQTRQQVFQTSYQAMGQYSYKFYAHNARMGRALNAMLMRGFTELVASYIESKTKQYALDAAELAYQAIAYGAKGNLAAAAAFGVAAVKAAALAGVGALAAGYVRSYGEDRAETMTKEWEAMPAPGEGDDEDLSRQKRQASGVVNARPIHINVYSTANFNSGYMIFGDSEAAATELYEERFRERIESDIESGEIQV